MFDFLSKQFGSIFTKYSNKTLNESNLKESLQLITDALIEADVPYELVQVFVQDVYKNVVGKQLVKSVKPGEQFVKIVHDQLKAFLGDQVVDQEILFPAKIMMMGLQGSGKTTSIAKLSYHLQQKSSKSLKVLVASVDFCRPAAIDQLEQLAAKVNVDFYRSCSQSALNAAIEICNYAQEKQYDILFLDTAGRLHVDDAMLDQLNDIKNAIVPTKSYLVLDAMTGQESLKVANSFNERVGFDAAILTKMDSDTRGGAAFSFRYALKKPIQFIGVGEKIEELEEFKPDRMAGRILDMGDVVTLVERAERQIKQEEQESLQKRMSSGVFSLEDFAQQMDMLNKLGSMRNVMKYLPGMGSFNLSEEQIHKGEVEFKKFRSIISSMTPKERIAPKILNESRKHRIAKGSGLAVSDVNLLLSRFEEMQQYVKLLSKFGGGRGIFR